MSRPLRIQYPDAWYHVMNKGRRGERDRRSGISTYERFILKEIGRQFGIAKYSSASSAIEKVKRDISIDRRLKASVKNIEKIAENSQQQICPLLMIDKHYYKYYYYRYYILPEV